MQINDIYIAREISCVRRVKASFVHTFFACLTFSCQTRIPFMGYKESGVSPAREATFDRWASRVSTCIAYISFVPKSNAFELFTFNFHACKENFILTRINKKKKKTIFYISVVNPNLSNLFADRNNKK
jgi:hypothetical protein